MQEETKSSQKAEMKVVDKLKHTGAITAPSLFTLGNLACGFFSILAAAKGHFAQAGWLILFANNPDAASKNERNLIQLFQQNNPARFAHVEQLTGAIARRIECWVKPGQEIKTGDHLGLVRFGSQVAVYLPKNSVRVLVKEGQKVQGGLTVLALWK